MALGSPCGLSLRALGPVLHLLGEVKHFVPGVSRPAAGVTLARVCLRLSYFS